MNFIDDPVEDEGKPADPVEEPVPNPIKIYYPKEVVEMMPNGKRQRLDYSKPTYQYTNHLKPAVDRADRAIMIEKCLAVLKPYNFDTFAFSGLSGAAVGFVLAHLLDKEVIVIRKPHEYTRAGSYEVQGYRKSKIYMIVDDLISTGVTAGRVIRGVDSIAPQAKLMGVLMYTGVPHVIMDNGEEPYTWDSIFRHSREEEQ